jgi:phosphoglycerate dehydrogenase-like enzyme
MPRIALLDDYQQAAHRFAEFEQLPESCDVVVFDSPFDASTAASSEPDAVAEALQGFDVVCCMRERTRFDADRLARLPDLKLLITTGARNASIDVAAAQSQGVVVCGTRSPGHAASELAWALVLGLQRHLVAEDASMRDGRWQTTVGRDCHGLTLGLLGLGRHGANVARFGQAFGMRCIAWSTNLEQARCDEVGVEYVSREDFFSQSDVLSIHLVMGKRNRGLVGADELALMKPDALLINTSRGPIVDEDALVATLKAGAIGGAGLDVYAEEPVPVDHPLRTAPRTLLTSHVGFVTEQTYKVFYGETVEAIEAWLDGAPIRQLTV